MSLFLRSAPLLLTAWALPAAASPLEIGVGLDLVRDLPDRAFAVEHASFGIGGGLAVPVRYHFTDRVALRATLSGSAEGGSDRVEWAQTDGQLVYSDSHWSMVTAAGLMLGPEIAIPLSGPVTPYWGAVAGGQLVHTWHSFGGATSALLDPAQNDLDNPNNIDPYTGQLAPAAGLQAGVRIASGLPFALQVEAGYTVSFVREEPLRKSLAELDAVRAPFGLNPLRLGVAATFPIGSEAEK